jgi:hypothetical protein
MDSRGSLCRESPCSIHFISGESMKEVLIIGMGKSRSLAPSDPGCEVWGVNRVYKQVSIKIDKLFFFDDYRIFGIEELKKTKSILVTKEPIDGLDVEVYPLQDIISKFKTDYFANTITYMIAYAVYLGFKRIRMYGVDMSHEKEYLTDQKPCVEFWIGFAMANGVTVDIGPGSEVRKVRPLYGYEKNKFIKGDPMIFKSKYAGATVAMNDDKYIKFKGGVYRTNDAEEIAFLSRPEFASSIFKIDEKDLAKIKHEINNQGKGGTSAPAK